VEELVSIFAIVTIIIILVVLAAFIQLKVSKTKGELPYERKGVLFTPAERSFIGVLKQTVGDQYEVLGQVRVADLLVVKKGLDKSSRQSFFNKTRIQVPSATPVSLVLVLKNTS